eukprot:365401-Chlamydomonas_euryale.AAC.2
MEAHFHQALFALFGADPSAQAAANGWLAGFASTSDAWSAALGLLNGQTPPPVAFFCANMLLSKARAEWGGLGGDQRQQLHDAVRWVGMLPHMHARVHFGTAWTCACMSSCIGMLLGTHESLHGRCLCKHSNECAPWREAMHARVIA